MTDSQALMIINKMKNGLYFLQDDPIKSIVTEYSYDESGCVFVLQQTDTGVGYIFPEARYTEETFREFLKGKYEYEEFLAETYHRKRPPARGSADSIGK
jgi:hypothetical protein